jgi:hypothetical protein
LVEWLVVRDEPDESHLGGVIPGPVQGQLEGA